LDDRKGIWPVENLTAVPKLFFGRTLGDPVKPGIISRKKYQND